MNLARRLKTYFKKRRKEREKEQVKRLAEAGFVLGAVIAAENDGDEFDVICAGIAGVLVAGILEVLFPKTADMVKSIL